MYVAIDARPIRPPYSGVAQYVANLALALLDVAPEDEIALASPHPEHSRELLSQVAGNPQQVRLLDLPLGRKGWTFACRATPGIAGRLLSRQGRPDVYHLTYFEAMPRFDKTVKRICTVHDVIPLMHPEWFPKRNVAASLKSFRSLSGAVDAVLTPSKTTADRARELGLDCPIFVTPLAASVLPPSGSLPKEYPFDRPYALYLGNIEPRKGVVELVEAWSASASARDYRLLIAGKPAYLASPSLTAIDEAQRRGVDIVHLGFVTEEMKALAMARAEVFLYPSRDEGFGIPVLEAMALGVPVIATTGGSLPEVSGDAAVLVQPGSVDDLGQAIDMVLGNGLLRESLAAAGKLRAASFSWRGTAEATLEAYGTVHR